MLIFDQEVRLQIEDVVIQYQLMDRDRPVVITFAPGDMGLSQQEFDSGVPLWGFAALRKYGFNVISFDRTRIDCRYQSDQLSSFIIELGEQLQVFPERIGYGSSRGGYGVSIHARALRLDRALLMMPITSYDAAIVPFEPRSEPGYRGPDGADCPCELTLIYDPFCSSDRQHANRYHAEVHHLRLPGVGHTVVRCLQSMGLLKRVVLSYLNKELDPVAFSRWIRSRRNLRLYHSRLPRTPAARRTAWRRRVFLYHKLRWKLASLSRESQRLQERREKQPVSRTQPTSSLRGYPLNRAP
jgi:hypothetical protein